MKKMATVFGIVNETYGLPSILTYFEKKLDMAKQHFDSLQTFVTRIEKDRKIVNSIYIYIVVR